jgi:hypothetical protein
VNNVTESFPIVAYFFLILAASCAAFICLDMWRGHRQRMAIMNLVLPLTALYSGPLGLWAYLRIGRLSSRDANSPAQPKPLWQSVLLAATHCGSGCTLGVFLIEGLLILFTLSLFGREIFAAWVLDFAAAFATGIAFQYFTIQPMRKLSPGAGLRAALKADALSLTAWQVGMYAWMGLVTFVFAGQPLDRSGPVFWFMMQLAMLCGFVTRTYLIIKFDCVITCVPPS